MTKSDVVGEISKSTGIEKILVAEVVESFMETIKDSMINGDNIYFRGFGSFVLKARAEKIARNIGPNVAITVPAHNVPVFRPSKEFVAQVKEKVK